MVWKIGCNSDGFKEVEAFPGRMFQFEYMLKTLAELGYDSVEPQVATGQASSMLYGYDPTLSLESDPIEVKKLITSYGLDLICISAHANLMDVGEAGPSYLKKAISYAKLVGAEIVNTSEGPRPKYLTEEEGFQLMKLNLKFILDMAKNFSIKLTIEPHNIYTVQTGTMLRILNLVQSDMLGVNFDTGNVALFGTDPLEMLDAMIDRVMHIHLKDIGREILEKHRGETAIPAGTTIGEGVVPIKQIVDRLKRSGFDGELSVECGGIERLRKSITYIRSIM